MSTEYSLWVCAYPSGENCPAISVLSNRPAKHWDSHGHGSELTTTLMGCTYAGGSPVFRSSVVVFVGLRATPALVFDSHGLRLPSYTNLPLKCMSEAILLENFYRNRFLYINFGEFFLCIVAITKHEPEHETLISDVTGLFVIGSEAFLSATNPGGTERATP